MRLLNLLWQSLAVAYVSEANPECSVCQEHLRPTYVHVDVYSGFFEQRAFVRYIKKMVDAGADHIILGHVKVEENDVTGSAGRYEELEASVRDELHEVLKNNNAKLLLSLGGGYHGCALLTSNATTTARQWCQYARDQGYKGVNFNLDGLVLPRRKGPQVHWFLDAAVACREQIDLVTFTVQAERIDVSSRTAIDELIEYSEKANERFLILFRDPPTQEVSLNTTTSDAEIQLIQLLTKKTPYAKGKLVIGKYMYGRACTHHLPAANLTSLLERAEAVGISTGVMMYKAPAINAPELPDFVDRYIQTVRDRRIKSSSTRNLLATSDAPLELVEDFAPTEDDTPAADGDLPPFGRP